jgi:hypothetical protein
MALFHNGNEIAGSVVIGMLLGAAALEAFLNFCLGCVFFGLGIQLGLIPDTVYRIYTDTRDKVAKGWHYSNDAGRNSEAPKEVYPAFAKTSADLKYKRVKSDEHILSDFHVIRNMQVISLPRAAHSLVQSIATLSYRAAYSAHRIHRSPGVTYTLRLPRRSPTLGCHLR